MEPLTSLNVPTVQNWNIHCMHLQKAGQLVVKIGSSRLVMTCVLVQDRSVPNMNFIIHTSKIFMSTAKYCSRKHTSWLKYLDDVAILSLFEFLACETWFSLIPSCLLVASHPAASEQSCVWLTSLHMDWEKISYLYGTFTFLVANPSISNLLAYVMIAKLSVLHWF